MHDRGQELRRLRSTNQRQHHYTGNVVITQGTLKAHGAQAKVYLSTPNSEISRVVLTGSPAHLEQRWTTSTT